MKILRQAGHFGGGRAAYERVAGSRGQDIGCSLVGVWSVEITPREQSQPRGTARCSFKSQRKFSTNTNTFLQRCRDLSWMKFVLGLQQSISNVHSRQLWSLAETFTRLSQLIQTEITLNWHLLPYQEYMYTFTVQIFYIYNDINWYVHCREEGYIGLG